MAVDGTGKVSRVGCRKRFRETDSGHVHGLRVPGLARIRGVFKGRRLLRGLQLDVEAVPQCVSSVVAPRITKAGSIAVRTEEC